MPQSSLQAPPMIDAIPDDVSKDRSQTKSGPIRLLRNTLLANGAFSGFSGLLCLFKAEAIGRWMGIQTAEISALGMELAIFSTFLFILATRKDLRKRWVQNSVLAVIGLDVLWVVASAVLLLAPSTTLASGSLIAISLTTAGRWTVLVVALVVADFAFFQMRAWQGIRRQPQ